MRVSLICVCAICFSVCSAQEGTNVALPTIIPPSPEVAQLGKVGSLSAGLHTGSANVTIPLYSLGVDKAKVDIMLSYSSNGIKVSEIPGMVGLGWNLIAGGVVSRTVHDEPDGVYPYLQPPANPSAKNQETLTYLLNATKFGDTKDTEYDEYSYSFNGMSGKFFLNPATGEGYCIPHNTFKVKVNNNIGIGSKWVDIRTPDGILYKFGYSTKEETRDISISGGGGGIISKTGYFETAWFLDQVVTPEGSTISFAYSRDSIRTIQGVYQTMIKPVTPTQQYNCNFNCSDAYSEQTGVNQINYITHRLTSITTSDGVSVNFVNELRPDASGDKRVKSMTVSSTSGGVSVLIKRYGFEYIDPTFNNTTSINRRFFLSKLKTIDVQTGIEEIPESSLEHSFEYFEMNNMSTRLSYGQDYFGYDNGASNTYFTPLLPEYTNGLFNGSRGGNREPSQDDKRKRGILTRVNYPTGGYEEFSYEPHSVLQYVSTQAYTGSQSIGGSGLGSFDPQTFVSPVFTSTSEQSVSFSLKSFKSPAFPEAPSGEGDIIFDFKLIKISTGDIVLRKKYLVYSEENITVLLGSNTDYRMELTVRGQVNAGSAFVRYNPVTNSGFENKDVGGLRVNEIKSFDPVTGKTNHKYYRYTSFADLSTGKSSGIGPTKTLNFVPYTSGTLICQGTPQAHIAQCTGYMISASSLMPFYTFGGSHIAYTNVIESDDANFANGLVEHFFNTYYPGVVNTVTVLGSSSLSTPTNISTDLNGTEYLTRYYKKTAATNPFVLLKEVANDYTISEGIYNKRSDYIVRMRWEENYHVSPPYPGEFEGFDVLQYNYISQWIRLNATTTTDYDQNGQNPLVSKVSYSYDNLAHLQPTRVDMTVSDGSTQSTINKYAHDFAQTAPVNQYQKLVQSHQLNQVIETTTLKGTKELNTVRNEQKIWKEISAGDVLIIGPDAVSTKKTASGSAETRIRYHRIDDNNNVLEVSKEGGTRISYIYDYGNTFPVAEVKNASIVSGDSIAYTSFEADGKGYWTFSGTAVSDFSAPTGNKCYSLSSGNISRTVNPAKTYLLTYWVKNGSGTVSANSTISTKQLMVKNGWTAYELKISGTSAITVSGTGTIDELRLHPSGSLMTTFTHKSYVGISSSASANSMLTRYEYDGYNRLKLVRDGDRNILKQYEYAYGQTYTSPCTNTTANWTVTGVLRCKREPVNNNFTNQKEQEEKDMNNCSPTYQQTRWVTISGTYSECAPVANCTGEGKRVIGNVCVDGVKIFTYRSLIGGVWYCTYHYEWANGTIKSADYNATGTLPCNPAL